MKIKCISFSNSITGQRFKKATKLRIEQFLELRKTSVFDSVRHYSEIDLDKDYTDVFGEYSNFYGYAKWAWKPYIIIKELEKMNDGDFLAYVDTGCIFNLQHANIRDWFEKLYADIDQHDLKIGISYLYKGKNYLGDQKYILDKFRLFGNNDFYDNFNHYESGLLFIIKNQKTLDFMKQWYQFYIDNKIEIFNQLNDRRHKRIGEDRRNDHDDCDQQILHCLIYTQKPDIYGFCSNGVFYNGNSPIKYARFKD